jgi:predicted nucleic-acid-binding Zn-ribbon protein
MGAGCATCAQRRTSQAHESNSPRREHVAESLPFKCLRCGYHACDIGEIHVAGGFWSKVFDVEGRKFSTVTCERCKHTEFFKADRSKLANIFDLFVT